MTAQQLFIAVKIVQHPRYDDTRVRPDRSARTAGTFQRGGIHRKFSPKIGFLIVRHVPHKLFVKRVCFRIVRCRRRKNLRVCCPTQALVPLRTIGRNIDKIAALTAPHIFDQTVEFIVRRTKTHGFLHLRADPHRCKICGINLPFRFHEHVTKSVIGEVRLYLLFLSVAHIYVFRFCRTQIVAIETPVLQNFSVAQNNFRTSRQTIVKPYKARRIVFKIQNLFTLRRKDQLRFLRKVFRNSRRVFRNKIKFALAHRSGKTLIRSFRIVPVFSVIDAVFTDHAFTVLPTLVRRYLRPVFRDNNRIQVKTISVNAIAAVVNSESAFKPAVPKIYFDRIAFFQQTVQGIGLIPYAFPVIVHERRKIFSPDPFSVHKSAV